MERFSRDTISLTTAELNELKANKALDPTVEYWVDKNRIVNASGPDTLVDGAGSAAAAYALSGVSGLNQIVTAIIAAGWAYDSVQWKRNTAGTIVNATGAGSTTLAYTQVAADLVPGVKIYPEFVTMRYQAALTAPVAVPDAPTIGFATAVDGTATFAFTAPENDGGSVILDYEVLLINGIRKTVASPATSITVTTANGTAVTATVRARNAVGYSAWSAQSNSVTPSAVVAVTAITTNAITFNGSGSIAIPSNTAWDFANDLWCIVGCFKATGIGGSAINRTLLSTGLGSADTVPLNSANLLLNGSAGTTSPGSLEFRWRDGTNAVRTVTSALPLGDGCHYMYAVQRTAAGRIEMLTAPIMATAVDQAQTSVITMGALTNANQIVIGHTFDLRTQRGFNGTMPFIGKKTGVNITPAELLQMANGNVRPGDLAAHPAASWDALYYMTASAGTYADQSGKGNTATRSASGVGTATNGGPTFGPSIVLNAVAEKRVWQESVDTVNGVPMTVTGVWNGVAGDLQQRLIGWTTCNEPALASWADSAVGVSPGAFSSTRGGFRSDNEWQIIEVRSKTYPQIVARTKVKCGVGVVGINWFQSQQFNMFNYNVGQPVANDLTSHFKLSDGTWNQPNGCGARNFLNNIQPLVGCPVALINSAVGGTGMIANEGQGYWDDTSPTGLYQTQIIAVLPQCGGSASFAVGNGGGSDARQSIEGSRVAAAFGRMVNRMMTDFGRDASNFKFFVTGTYRYENPILNIPSVAPKYQDVRSAIDVWANSGVPGVVWCGSTVDLSVPGDNGLHWMSLEQTTYGLMLAQTFNNAYGFAGYTYSGAGPRITGATRTGAVIDFATSANGGGATLRKGAKDVNSFRFSLTPDFATLITDYTVTFPGSGIVRATLPSNPGATVYADYCWGAMPGGDTKTVGSETAGFVYDDRTIFTNTRGAPLQPSTSTLVVA